nr:uncharacterized protein LOC113722701 [Coffea arabica]
MVTPPTYPYGMPAWYDPQAVCAYHSGAPGHSTLDCKALKHKVQDMIEAGEIVIRKREAQGPNINRNPLPEHANTIGVILDDAEYDELAQKLARKLRCFGVTDRPFIIEDEPFEEDKSFILDLTLAESKALEPVVIEFPEQEPVLSLQRVPWNYDEPVIQIGEKSVAKEEVSVVTRSGRIASIEHNKALYIAVRCNGKILPKVLIDNGSALNICPWSTLEKLGLQDIKLRPSGTIVRGFDGAQREPIGEVDLVIEMGPAQFQIACQVMHFPSVYNILLGRPWNHKSGAVPSSLHQLLKFIVNDKLITIFAEQDCLVIADSGSKEDGSQNATVTPHSTSDIVSVSWITKEERALSKASVI